MVKLSGVILIAYCVIFILPKSTFLSITDEDGIYENLSAVFFLISAVVFFLLYAKAKFFDKSADRSKFSSLSRRWVFLFLGLAMFLGFGEEISWGQRILNFQTPEALERINVQEEFNIHNLEIFNVKYKDGVYKTGIRRLFTMKQLFVGSFLCYLLILPLLYNRSNWARKLVDRFYIPVPTIKFGLLFIINYGVYQFLTLVVADSDLHWGLTEIQEFNFALILMLLPFFWFRLPEKRRLQDNLNF